MYQMQKPFGSDAAWQSFQTALTYLIVMIWHKSLCKDERCAILCKGPWSNAPYKNIKIKIKKYKNIEILNYA